MKLLTREEFREGVFARDKVCVICRAMPTSDHAAHHIMERRLWTDPTQGGGYFLDNGALVCGSCHILAEQTVITCEQLREACGITKVALPMHLYNDYNYDKWGDIKLPNGTRLKGELFNDESVQKILKEGGVLDQFVDYVKYPRTMHCPWSNPIKDDKVIESLDKLEKLNDVVASLKLDGENCLSEETILYTDNGYKTIKEICDTNYKGNVLTYNLSENSPEMSTIESYSILPSTEEEWYEIILENNEKLIVTGEHFIWLPEFGCYRKVKFLNGTEKLLLK